MPAGGSGHLGEHDPLGADLPQIARKDPADQMAADEPVKDAGPCVGWASAAVALITGHLIALHAAADDRMQGWLNVWCFQIPGRTCVRRKKASGRS